MPELPMTTGHYGRPLLGLPPIRLINALTEQTLGGPGKAVRFPRPGLDVAYSVGAGPIYRQFQVPGLFNSSVFSVSGGELFKGTTDLGGVAYGLTPRMAAANGNLAIVNGGGLYVYDGSTLTQVEFFDDGVSRLPSFSGVAVLYDIFIFPVVGSNQFFFSSVGDPTTIDAANFGAAQTSPDPIVEVSVLAEEIYFLKAKAVEIWDYSGSLTAPFALSQGRTYAKGCVAQSSVVLADNALFWIGDDLAPYRSGSVPQAVGTPYIVDRMAACGDQASSITAMSFVIENHPLVLMNLAPIGESYAYDVQTKEWARWGTQTGGKLDPGLFAAGHCAGQGADIYLGSYDGPQVYRLDRTSRFDGETPMRTVISAALWMGEGVAPCRNVSLNCRRGVGNAQTADPLVQMRFSDDLGETWSPWLAEELGRAGATGMKATWWGLGQMEQPGRLFEFALSDPVSFPVMGASYNAARP